MAFKKTSVGVTPATPIDSGLPRIGEVRDGKVWDGDEWISKEDWDRIRGVSSDDPKED